jgi:hypothetical protein
VQVDDPAHLPFTACQPEYWDTFSTFISLST